MARSSVRIRGVGYVILILLAIIVLPTWALIALALLVPIGYFVENV